LNGVPDFFSGDAGTDAGLRRRQPSRNAAKSSSMTRMPLRIATQCDLSRPLSIN
jgi:hypothetical protein